MLVGQLYLDRGSIGTRSDSVACTVKGLGVNVLVRNSTVKLLCVSVEMGSTQLLKLGLMGVCGFTGLML